MTAPKGHQMKTTLLIIVSVLAVLTSAANADQVRIPVGQQSQQNTEKPEHGMRSQDVEAHYGAPASKHGPIGNPSIHYWEYESFTVYFEGDRVIHTVIKTHLKLSN